MRVTGGPCGAPASAATCAPPKLFDWRGSASDIRSVKVGTAKVARCRPIFKDWRATFTVLFEESALQRGDLDMSLRDAGSMIGVGDYRPRFGRFEVVAAS